MSCLVTTALINIEMPPSTSTSILQVLFADVYARHLRRRADRTSPLRFALGINEFSGGIELRAATEGLCHRDFCKRRIAQYKAFYDELNVSYDVLIGTSSARCMQRHMRDLVVRMAALGLIKERVAPMVYCSSCRKILTEQYIRGWCFDHLLMEPTTARCASCSYPTATVARRAATCTMCGSIAELRGSKQLYLQFNKLAATALKPREIGAEPRIAIAEQISSATSHISMVNPHLYTRTITRTGTYGVTYDDHRVFKEIDGPMFYHALVNPAWPPPFIYQFIGSSDSIFYGLMPYIEAACGATVDTTYASIDIAYVGRVVDIRHVHDRVQPDLLRLFLLFNYAAEDDTAPLSSPQQVPHQVPSMRAIATFYNTTVRDSLNPLLHMLDEHPLAEYSGLGNIDVHLFECMCVFHTMFCEYIACFEVSQYRPHVQFDKAIALTFKIADITQTLYKKMTNLVVVAPTQGDLREQYRIVIANAIYYVGFMLEPFAPAAAAKLLQLFEPVSDAERARIARPDATRFEIVFDKRAVCPAAASDVLFEAIGTRGPHTRCTIC